MASLGRVVYTPEGGSRREWTIDWENAPWDLRTQTERLTGWPWIEFTERMQQGSGIALDALVFVLRKRDEPRLAPDAVRVELNEIDFEDVEPEGDADPKEAETP